MKILKILLGVILVIVVVSFVFLKNDNKESIKIGVQLFLTGPASALGETQKRAVYLAQEKINAEGGIDGRPVEIIISDSGYDPKIALNSYNELKFRGVKYIVTDGSPVVASLRETVLKDGNLIITGIPTTPAYFDGDNMSCRIALTAKNFGPAYSELLEKNKYQKIATLLPDNEYGRGIYEELKKEFKGDILISEFYNTQNSVGDYRTNLTKIKARQGENDAIVIAQVTNTIEPMLNQMRELGIVLPIITDYYTVNNPSLNDKALLGNAKFVDYEYQSSIQSSDSDIARDFKAKYQEKYKSEAPLFVVATYDPIVILLDAIKAVGDNPKKVGEYISQLENYSAVTGTLTFNEDCEVDRKPVFREIVKGKIVDL